MKLEKKHYYWGAAILALLLIFIYRNAIMSALGINGESTERLEVMDANGNGTGQYVTRPSSSVARGLSCCNTGTGFIGGCKYPITRNDRIPSCSNL